MIDGAMYDAVNAANGSTFTPLYYSGGAVSGVNASAAALQAALTVMNNLYVNPTTSLYQQFAGQTGASFFSSGILAAHPAFANDQVGPTISQMAAVLAGIGSLQAELAAIRRLTPRSSPASLWGQRRRTRRSPRITRPARGARWWRH